MDVHMSVVRDVATLEDAMSKLRTKAKTSAGVEEVPANPRRRPKAKAKAKAKAEEG